MDHDSCIISREAVNMREKELKAKLFGTAANNYKPLGDLAKPKTYIDDMKKREEQTKQHLANMPVNYLQPKSKTTSIENLQKNEMQKLTRT